MTNYKSMYIMHMIDDEGNTRLHRLGDARTTQEITDTNYEMIESLLCSSKYVED